jgi:hypothetical protein
LTERGFVLIGSVQWRENEIVQMFDVARGGGVSGA